MLVLALYSCRTTDEKIKVSPSPVFLMPDAGNTVTLDVKFRVPAHYLAARSRMVITPEVQSPGDEPPYQLPAIAADGKIYTKKLNRRKRLNGYVDPMAGALLPVQDPAKAFTLHYSHSCPLPADVLEGRLYGVVSADGCGDCSSIDTIYIGEVENPLGRLSAPRECSFVLQYPEFVVRPKVFEGKDEARLQFHVNKWDIVMDLADNRAELTRMLETLQPIVADSLSELTSLSIFGSASAEASYQHNIMLANNRANAARRWLGDKLQLKRREQNAIKIGAAPEGWEPVVQAMRAAGDADSAKVRELMIKYPGPTDDAAEAYIRRLPCWTRIRDNYLAKDRKVMYSYTWTVRSFTTDAELLDVYRTRPDAFNEDEFLRVASLAEDDASREQVYEKLLRYFPASPVALANLSILRRARGDNEAVVRLLQPVQQRTPEMTAVLVASLTSLGRTDEACEVALHDGTLSDARYNLGLLFARQRQLDKAWKLLEPYNDQNSRIVKQVLGK